jgi:hypothetical protein
MLLGIGTASRRDPDPTMLTKRHVLLAALTPAAAVVTLVVAIVGV